MFYDAHEFVARCDACQRMDNIRKRNEMPQKFILEVEVFEMYRVLTTWNLSRDHTRISTSYWQWIMSPSGLRHLLAQ